MTCPVCHKKNLKFVFKSLDERFQKKGKFLLIECCNCNLFFTLDVSGKKKKNFDLLFQMNKKEKEHVNKRRHCFVNKYLNNGDKILDIGFGDGSFLKYMKSKGYKVTGIENSIKAIKNLKKESIEIIQGDFERRKIRKKFSLITLWHSFEHFNDPLGALNKIRRIIEKNGILAIEVPNPLSLQAKLFQNFWYGFDLARHKFHFSPQALSDLLEKSGFEVVKKDFSNIHESLMHFIFSLANFFGLSSVNYWGIKNNRRNETSFKKIFRIVAYKLINVFYPLIWLESKLKKNGVVTFLAQPKKEMKKCSVSIGIPAHNEEKDIAKVVKAIVNQNMQNRIKLKEIIVVADGCTDRTEEIVIDLALVDTRIKLISKKREGKSAAINTILKSAKEEIIIIANADNIPDDDCLFEILSPLSDKKVGLVGPQIVCINKDNNFVGYLNNLLWRLHHRISFIEPKTGGFIALRKKYFNCLPEKSPVDEATIEAIIKSKNKKIKYAPRAKLYLKGPENLNDYFKQRRRIHFGYFWLKEKYTQYHPSTFKAKHLFSVLVKEISPNIVNNFFLLSAIFLEVVAKIAGFYDFKKKRKDHQKWEMVASSKGLELEK